MEDLQAKFDYLPFSAVRRPMHSGSLDGGPDRVTNSRPSSEFCEDCVNGKLTRVLHTRPAARTEVPLQRVYTNVDDPVSTRSQRGNVYWVSFIDVHSRFPAVDFIRHKSDVFVDFKRYMVWAENVTGRKLDNCVMTRVESTPRLSSISF